MVASLFREVKLRLAGTGSVCDDLNYDGFVVMPTKEEIWAVVSNDVVKTNVEEVDRKS